MTDSNHDPSEVEYVGAPTEYADTQEVPEWVEMAAKLLFFLPGALVTATTIPIILFAMMFVCMVLCVIAAALIL